MSGSAMGRTKECGKCQKTLPTKDFNRHTKNPDGFQWFCRECQRLGKRIHRYGVTPDWFDSQMESQDSRCAICEVHIEKYIEYTNGKRIAFDVDHCHTTGKARSLLCSTCNILLGLARDNQELLKKAARYLKRHDIV